MDNPLAQICIDRDLSAAEKRRWLEEAIAAGAELEATDKNGVRALHHAVRFRSTAAVETLLEAGADVNAQCRRNGSTPLHRAVTATGAPGTAGQGDEAREIVRLLLAAGADPTKRNKQGKSPLDCVTDPSIRAMLEHAGGKTDGDAGSTRDA